MGDFVFRMIRSRNASGREQLPEYEDLEPRPSAVKTKLSSWTLPNNVMRKRYYTDGDGEEVEMMEGDYLLAVGLGTLALLFILSTIGFFLLGSAMYHHRRVNELTDGSGTVRISPNAKEFVPCIWPSQQEFYEPSIECPSQSYCPTGFRCDFQQNTTQCLSSRYQCMAKSDSTCIYLMNSLPEGETIFPSRLLSLSHAPVKFLYYMTIGYIIVAFSLVPLLSTAVAAYSGFQWTFASLMGIIVLCNAGIDLLAYGAYHYAHQSTNVCPFQCFDFPTDVQLDLLCKLLSSVSLLNWFFLLFPVIQIVFSIVAMVGLISFLIYWCLQATVLPSA